MKLKPKAMRQTNNAPIFAFEYSLRPLVQQCRRDEKFLEQLKAILMEVDEVVAASGANCNTCGYCCNFHLVGHKLYVSTGELALLSAWKPAGEDLRDGICPYLVGSQCDEHERRPLGCRVYFCKPPRRQWSQQIYEPFHNRIRRLHEESGIPYLYIEIVAAMRQLSS